MAWSLVARHGHHATAFQALEPELQRWLAPDGRALVGYVAASRHLIAAGNPICEPEHLADAALAFAAHAEARGCKAAFFSADDALVEALERAGIAHDTLRIGLQPEWRPQRYHTRGAARRTLRSQVNRGRNKGVTVRPLAPHALAPGTALRQRLEALVAHWLDARAMGPMGFMVAVAPFEHAEHRRYFVAERSEQPIALLAAAPVPARDGWFFETIVRHTDAPNGTVELLIDTAMRSLADEGARYVSLGLAPLAGVVPEPGRHRALRRVMHWCYAHLGGVYNFAGLERFKARFAPDHWAPQYLVTVGGRITPLTTHAMLEAFSGGHLAFATQTLLRMTRRLPRKVWLAALTAMTALLVPWTALLASADAERWFGSPAARTGWVVFDALMIAALATLLVLLKRRAHRAARRLALVLGALTLGDFALTLHGALTLDLDPGGLLEWTALLAGCTAPLLATMLLVGLARLARL